MQANTSNRPLGGFIVVGGLLVVAGLAAIAAQQAGIDPIDALAEAGWPLFIIVPGLALLAASLLPQPPQGLGFAIPGAIVTTVGLVLFYQDATGHWESWAYAWALVGPGAAGLAILVYGLLFRQRDLVGVGLRLTLIAAVLFAVGFWYFESIFDTGRVPVDLGALWPFALIALGVVALALGVLNTGRHDGEQRSTTTDPGGVR